MRRLITILVLFIFTSCTASRINSGHDFAYPHVKKEYIKAEKRINKHIRKYKKHRKLINKKIDKKQKDNSPTYLYY